MIIEEELEVDERLGGGPKNIDCIRIVSVHTFLTITSIIYTTECYEYDELKLRTMSLAVSYVPILIKK